MEFKRFSSFTSRLSFLLNKSSEKTIKRDKRDQSPLFWMVFVFVSLVIIRVVWSDRSKCQVWNLLEESLPFLHFPIIHESIPLHGFREGIHTRILIWIPKMCFWISKRTWISLHRTLCPREPNCRLLVISWTWLQILDAVPPLIGKNVSSLLLD